ncbi:MAG: hypothetical protein PHY04_02810 [Candidatus ainarchaeum sp.]|nr:hypothetical protein [Candidatus ainarchaeum sp.]MDD4128640.1 hypothetical protein [Candidatus ainarchaeum sp.]MDD4467962.1 hypothetical protein [Candidatus ainarchaeum sp.]
MVLESVIGVKNIKSHPVFIFFLTLFICAGSIFFAELIFPAHASVLSVAFITIGLVPLVYNILSEETGEEFNCKGSICATFFARHFNLIMIYVWIFLGIIVAFAFYYSFLPVTLRASLFEEQIKSFCIISGSSSCVNGVPFSIAGRSLAFGLNACSGLNSTVESCALFIFENNAGVLLFTILLSVLYGVGAIFIIAWNASILGVFFGETIIVGDVVRWLSMIQSMLIGHGPPELMGYVFGALAGGVLSAMVAKREFFTHKSSIIIKDVLFLSLLAIFSVGYGAVTEAIGIMGFSELYFLMGFCYLLLIVLAIFFYGKSRSSPRFFL